MLVPILSVIGLVVAFAGAVLLYFNAPSLFDTNSDGDITPTGDDKFATQRNRSQTGFLLVAVGFFFQLVATVASIFHHSA